MGEVTNLKAPAARMRYTRLRRQIENGTLIGTHGTPFQRSPEKTYDPFKKRKRHVEDMDDEETLMRKDAEKIKPENKYLSDEYKTNTLYERSEDEAPLAKRRATQLTSSLLSRESLVDFPQGPRLGMMAPQVIAPGEKFAQGFTGSESYSG